MCWEVTHDEQYLGAHQAETACFKGFEHFKDKEPCQVGNKKIWEIKDTVVVKFVEQARALDSKRRANLAERTKATKVELT